MRKHLHGRYLGYHGMGLPVSRPFAWWNKKTTANDVLQHVFEQMMSDQDKADRQVLGYR